MSLRSMWLFTIEALEPQNQNTKVIKQTLPTAKIKNPTTITGMLITNASAWEIRTGMLVLKANKNAESAKMPVFVF